MNVKNKFGRYIAVVVISRGIAFITISTLIETKVGATTCHIFSLLPFGPKARVVLWHLYFAGSMKSNLAVAVVFVVASLATLVESSSQSEYGNPFQSK